MGGGYEEDEGGDGVGCGGDAGGSLEGGELKDGGPIRGPKAGSNGGTMLELQVTGATPGLHEVKVSNLFFLLYFFLLMTSFRTTLKACTLCAQQWWRCLPMKDGS